MSEPAIKTYRGAQGPREDAEGRARMALTERDILSIADEIVRSLSGARTTSPSPSPDGRWLCDTAEEAVTRAAKAQRQLAELTLEKRSELVEAMRGAAIEHAQRLAELANEETGYGRVADKLQKNLLAARRTPGVEDLGTYCKTGDNGMMIVEQAPFGVIGSITPSTNPTATVINNAISMIAAGNAVVFNPHPAAKRASQEAMRVLADAIARAGGPEALITTVKEPTLASGQAVMTHPDVAMLSITGGEAVVAVAMKTGKKVVAAGPGNPPAIVDDTADIPKAAKDIVDGASFDNNVLCIAEKEVFVFASVADRLMAEMEKRGAHRVSGADIDKIVRTVLVQKDGKYVINRKYVGRDAACILRDAGVACPGDPRLVIAEVDADHPFVTTEMLMPVLAIVRVRDIDEAVEQALRAEQNNRHSAMIHSANVHNMSKAARRMGTTLFVKNAPSYAGLGMGGEGYTSMTIATPTGEGITTARTFTRLRRCVLYGDFRIS
ncbi:MAG: aldehyde dehydrogenase family protein [Christensenellaceae bacterium]|nr:aldehyde dehydrogenase family protein [Christensenellaceae bacterium]MEA5068740.1 aldehyde dehydrogenase family protein [Christensenellaceae bacterium]